MHQLPFYLALLALKWWCCIVCVHRVYLFSWHVPLNFTFQHYEETKMMTHILLRRCSHLTQSLFLSWRGSYGCVKRIVSSNLCIMRISGHHAHTQNRTTIVTSAQCDLGLRCPHMTRGHIFACWDSHKITLVLRKKTLIPFEHIEALPVQVMGVFSYSDQISRQHAHR